MSEKSGSASIWVAIIGGLVAATGWGVAYWKDVSDRESGLRNEIILRSLREDPEKTAQTLLWFHRMRMIDLGPETVQQLQNDPRSAPTSPRNEPAAVPPVDRPAPPQPGGAYSAETVRDPSRQLVSNLDADQRQVRLDAAEVLIGMVRSQSGSELSGLVTAIVEQVQGEALLRLTPSGRLNVITVLAEVDYAKIPRPLALDIKAAIERIEARRAEGITVGSQTQSQINRVKERLRLAGV